MNVKISAFYMTIIIQIIGLSSGLAIFKTGAVPQSPTTAQVIVQSPNLGTVPAFIQTAIPRAQVVGQSRLTMYFFKIYDATLFAPMEQFDSSQPFALSLNYLRDFTGVDIAERSIDEMQELGYTDNAQLAQWLEQMTLAFPNITQGDILTGVVDEQQHTLFYYNGVATHKINDPEFTQAFFAIWLDPNTSQPKMRKQLLGYSK